MITLKKLKDEVDIIANSMNDIIISSILNKFNSLIINNNICLHQKLRYFKIRCSGVAYYKQNRVNYFLNLELNKVYWTNRLSEYIKKISIKYKKLQKQYEKCNMCDFCINGIDEFVFKYSKHLNIEDLVNDYNSISNYLNIENPFIKLVGVRNPDFYIPKDQDFEKIDVLMEN